MTVLRTTVPTPHGPFHALVRSGPIGPVVLASGWSSTAAAVDAMAPEASDITASQVPAVVDAVAAYYDGDLAAPARLAVDSPGAGFVARARALLADIPAGAPVSYAELARRAGRPTAVRAAAMACSRNRAALFVPCHRVIRGDGSLGGFRWGLEVKRGLLAHEAG